MSSCDFYQEMVQRYLERYPHYTLYLLGEEPYPLIKKEEGFDLLCKERFLYGREDILSWHEKYWKSRFPIEATHLYLWGLGLGFSYLSVRSWLEQDEKRKVIFLEEDPKILLSFLSTEIAQEMVVDPRIEILLLPDGDLSQLSITEDRVEFIASPHCEEEKVSEKKQLFFRQATLDEGVFLDRIFSHIPFSHFIRNYPKALEAFFPQRWKDRCKDIPAILCGAGPSLELADTFLREAKDRALLFAGGSAISALAAKGIPFDFAMALDPNREEYVRLKPAILPNTPLLYTHRTSPEVFDLFSSPLGYVRSVMGQVVDLWAEEQWREEGEPIGFDLSDEAMSVTTLLLSLLSHLGCHPIILCGVDLAYVEKKRYAEGVGVDAGEQSKMHRAEEKRFLIPGKQGKIESCTRWIMEIETLNAFAKMHSKKKIFDASPLGALFSDIPFASFTTLLQEELSLSRDLSGFTHSLLTEDKKIDPKLHKEALVGLEKSLVNCKNYTEKIAAHLSKNKEISGRAVLYELELEEEIAYQLIFYDTLNYLQKKYPDDIGHVWKKLHDLIVVYSEKFLTYPL